MNESNEKRSSNKNGEALIRKALWVLPCVTVVAKLVAKSRRQSLPSSVGDVIAIN